MLGDKMVDFIALRWLVCKPWELATQASKQHLNSIWTMLDPRVWNCTKTTLEILSLRITAITFGGDLMMAMMIIIQILGRWRWPRTSLRAGAGHYLDLLSHQLRRDVAPTAIHTNQLTTECSTSLKCRAHRHTCSIAQYGVSNAKQTARIVGYLVFSG